MLVSRYHLNITCSHLFQHQYRLARTSALLRYSLDIARSEGRVSMPGGGIGLRRPFHISGNLVFNLKLQLVWPKL